MKKIKLLTLLLFPLTTIYATQFNVLINKTDNNYVIGETVSPEPPEPPIESLLFDDVKCSFYHCLGLKNGSVWYSGVNFKGAFGVGDEIKGSAKWVQVPKDNIAYSGVERIYATYGGTSFIKKGSIVYGAGQNDSGIIGTNDNKPRSVWTILKDSNNKEITNVSKFESVSSYSAYLERSDGLYYAGSGMNTFGSGNTLKYTKITSQKSNELTPGIHVVYRVGGTAYMGGYNSAGQLGDGSTTSSKTIKPYGLSGSGVLRTFGNDNNTFLLKSNGLYGAGSNGYNLITSSSSVNTKNFTLITNNYEDYKVGSSIIAAIKNKTLYLRGRNNEGQFGKPFDKSDEGKWINAGKIDSLNDVFLTSGFNVFVKRDGKLYASGKNDNGQLGIGTKTNINTWTLITK